MFAAILNFLKSDTISQLYIKIVIAIVIFFIGAIVAKITSKLVARILDEIEVNKIIHKATKQRWNISSGVSKIMLYSIYIISFILALNQLGVTNAILYFIAGFFILVILITFLLGVKDFIPNLFAGIFMLKKKALKIGDHIRCGKIEGFIEETGLVETKLRTAKGEHIFVPNSALIKKELAILNKSHENKHHENKPHRKGEN